MTELQYTIYRTVPYVPYGTVHLTLSAVPQVSSFILFFHLFVFLLTMADQCIDLSVDNVNVYDNIT